MNFWTRYAPHPANIDEVFWDLLLFAFLHVLSGIAAHSIWMAYCLDATACPLVAIGNVCPRTGHPVHSYPFCGEVMEMRRTSGLELYPPKDASVLQPSNAPQALDKGPPVRFDGLAVVWVASWVGERAKHAEIFAEVVHVCAGTG